MALRQIIDPGWAWDDAYGYAQCVRVGDTLYIAGQMPVGRDGGLIGAGDLAAQARQCFTNLADVLDAAGSRLADLVDVTYYLTDMGAVMGLAAVMGECLPPDAPAATVLGVTALFLPGQLIEIKATAVAH